MEPGGARVAELWAQGDNYISAVNYAELVSKLNERGMKDTEILAVVEGVPLAIVALEQEIAHAIGLLRTLTKKTGLSLGDRACLALGKSLQAQVVTADKVWGQLTGFKVLVVR